MGLPRPRPLALGETEALAHRAEGIYQMFEDLGVLSEGDLPGGTRSLQVSGRGTSSHRPNILELYRGTLAADDAGAAHLLADPGPDRP